MTLNFPLFLRRWLAMSLLWLSSPFVVADSVNLLVLDSFVIDAPWQRTFYQSLRHTMEEQYLDKNVVIYREPVQVFSDIDPAWQKSFRESLAYKYQHKSIDYVVLFGSEVSSRVGDVKPYFSHAQVLYFVESNDPRVANNSLPAPHVLMNIDIDRFINGIQTVYPFEQLIVVTNGDRLKNLRWLDAIDEAVLGLSQKITVHAITMDTIVSELDGVAKQGKRTAFLLLPHAINHAQHIEKAQRLLHEMNQRGVAPVFALDGSLVGQGVLGGWVFDPAMIALEAARHLTKDINTSWRSYIESNKLFRWIIDEQLLRRFAGNADAIHEPIEWRNQPAPHVWSQISSLWFYGLMTLLLAIVVALAMFIRLSMNKLNKLNQDNVWLSNILEGGELGTWVWNIQSGEVTVNERWANIIGYTLSELEPISILTWEKYTHPEDLTNSEVQLNKHFSGDTAIYVCEARMRHKDGHWIWIQDQGKVLMRDEKGAPLIMFGVHIDITVNKNLLTSLSMERDAAIAQSNLKNEFLINMSHEIRTPIHGLLGVFEILQAERHSLEQENLFKQGHASLRALSSMIGDVLDLSRIESGYFELIERPADIEALATDVRLVGQSLGLEKSLIIDVKVIGDGELPFLVCDKDRLQQVLISLINTVIHHKDKGVLNVEIHYQVTNNDRYLCRFCICDEGNSVVKHYLETVANEASSGVIDSISLQLAISMQLIELMGGQLRFGGDAEGENLLCFELDIPSYKAQPSEHHSGGESSLALQGSQILLVEDSPSNLQFGQFILERHGATCFTAANGAEAVKFLRENYSSIDLVLMDIVMPVMDGYTATRLIREEISKDIPIIALSANTSKVDSLKSKQSGMAAHINKPFSAKELVAVIKNVLNI